MFDEKKYNLPPQIFAALITGRGEMLKDFDVSVLRHKDVTTLLVMLADLIDDRRRAELEAAEEERIVQEAVRTMRGQADKLETTFLETTVLDREEGAG